MSACASSQTIIKGDIQDNDQIKIDCRLGGLANGYYEIYEPKIESPVVGKNYVFFLRSIEQFNDRPFFKYMFAGTFDGFVTILDNMIVPHNKLAVFTGTTYQSFIKNIELIISEK